MMEYAAGKSDTFWESLCDEEKKPFAVELDSPDGADVSKFMAGAQKLKDSGADIITIADCPAARARLDSCILACKVHRELGIEVLPHMTCRDRNRNAVKAALLGLSAEDVNNVLAVTGDPIPPARRGDVKGVYNFNSRTLAGYISSLRAADLPENFGIYAALNVNAHNFLIELGLAKEKQEKGVNAFFTQPILTQQAFENLKLARHELEGKIVGGIFPIVSHRNAQFINSEVAGIQVDEKVISLYENADRDRGEALALEISTEVARRIYTYIDGFYLMTPFGRTELIERIMDSIRKI